MRGKQAAQAAARAARSPGEEAILQNDGPVFDPVVRRRDRTVFGLLTLIVALGLALRLWGIGWSLPDPRHPLATYHPDELVNLNAVNAADLPHGKFDIGFYNYGTFYFYLVSFAHTLGRGWGLIPETPTAASLSPVEALTRLAPEQARLFLAGRLVTVLLGTATIGLVFALGRSLFGRRAGLAGALFYALSPLAVVHAHFLTVDVPATCFVVCALLGAARLLDARIWKNLILAGVGVGLAAATKYNAGLVLIAPLVALLPPRPARQPPDGAASATMEGAALQTPNGAASATMEGAASATMEGAALQTPNGAASATMEGATPSTRSLAFPAAIATLIGTAVLTFLIACPGPWLNWDAFWNGLPGYPGSGVRYELLEHARAGHEYLFTNTGPGWWYHLVVSLRFGLGVPFLFLAVLGLLLACYFRTPQDRILLAFFLLYYFTAGLSAVRFARYMLPLFPVCCLWAARLITAAWSPASGLAAPGTPAQEAQTPKWRARAWLWGAVGAIAVLATAGYTVSLVGIMACPDPRDAAADYLERSAPPGSSVAFAKIPWFYSPPLSPFFGALRPDVRAQSARYTTRFALRIPAREWDTQVLQPPPDYAVLSNIETMHTVERLHLETPTHFVRSIPTDYRRVLFAPLDSVWLSPYRTGLVPEDLLYILPVLTIFQKRSHP